MVKSSWSQGFSRTLWFLFYLTVFVFLLQHSFSFLDPDFGWHLRLGQEIASTGQVPSVNYSNYTLFGEQWVDHEWLSNLTVYRIYTNFGYSTLNLIFCLIPLLILIILNLLLRYEFKLDLRRYVWPLILFESFALIAVAPHLGVRVQEVTMLFFLFLLLIIFFYNKNKNNLILWCLLPLFYLWANLHGGFLMGLVVLLLFAIVKGIELFVQQKYNWPFLNFARTLSKRQIMIFVGFALLAFATTLLTPYHLQLYSFLSSYGNTFYLNHISEWMPQWAFPYQYWQFAYISILILALSFLAIDIFRKKQIKLDLWEGALLLSFLLLAIKSRRHFPLLFIVSMPWLFNFWLEYLGFKGRERIRLAEILKNKFIDPIFQISVILVWLVLIFNLYLGIKFTNQPFLSFCEDKYQAARSRFLYPCQALEFLKSKPELSQLRLLNNFNWGGYLLWQYPTKQLFIDGRMPQVNFRGRSILEEYFDFFKKDKLAAKLKEHKIELILINNQPNRIKLNIFEKKFLLINEEEINKKNEFLDYLASAPDWLLLYSDQVSLIYKKR
ncbi:MAG: hypothetical protein NTX66_01865 [Candidatus Falkowbacteria bacterium]|nr:hypothetical protein [Candidatus Falkowbacteria bacterium]